MKSNDDCEFIHHAQSVSLRNSHLDIKINTTSGCWDSLTFTPLDMQILDVGHASIPVEVGLDQSWLPGDDGWQVKEVNCSRDAEGVHCVLRLCCTNVEVYDSYTLQRNEPILARKAKVIYGGRDEKTFWGVLFRLPAISLGNKEECDVIAPGQSTLSRIPFYRQAAIKAHRPILKDIQHRLGHGRTPVGPLEPCPDITPGIVGIHNRELNFSVISWFYSWEDTAALSTEGFGDSLGITHHHRVEGWADLDREYTCGTQYIVLLRGEIRDALTFIRSTWSKLGVHTPPDKSIHSGDTTIFETSVQMEGGLARFSRKLPHLRDMGINMLYLLPVWLGTKVTDALYAADHALTYRLDPAWQRIRVPHRIISYDIMDPAVGTALEMRDFVTLAHSLGVRVLFDLVFHGVAPESPLLESHPEWFQRNLDGQKFASHDWLPSYSLDWANSKVQDYFIEFARRNVLDLDIDGFRIDAPFAKESNWARGLSHRTGESGFGGVKFVSRLRAELKAIKPDSILLCEMPGPIWDTMCDFCNDDPFLRMCLKVAMNEIQAADLQVWLADRLAIRVPGATRVLSIENHNSTRVNPSSLAYRGSPIARALFTICCLSGGVPLIWSGQQESQIRFYRELLQLCRSCPALRNGEVYLDALADTPDVFVVARSYSMEKLVGLVNCGSRWSKVTVGLPREFTASEVTQVWSSNKRAESFLEYDPSASNLKTIVEPYSSYLFRLE